MKQKPRILVTSISGWNSQTGSDTLSSLMNGYGSFRVANIFIRSDEPTSTACDYFFRISEGNVLKSVLLRKIHTGFVCSRKTDDQMQETIDGQQTEKRRYRFFAKHRFSLFLMLRELAWKCGKWNSDELNNFVDDFDPDVIFFPIESYIHFNRLNSYLIKKTKKKAVGFLWDDNFTYKTSHGPLQLLMRWFTRQSVRKLVSQCDTVLAINPKMKRECDEFFGINSILLTKGIDFVGREEPTPYVPKLPLKLLYAGKLIIGRDKSIELLAYAIGKYNHINIQIQLDIYTTTHLTEKQKNAFKQPGCFLHDAVLQTELPQIQAQADVLVFAEAISGPNSQAARLSFSTKLTEYFSAGKAILAVGPENIAPIEYLKNNRVALCACSSEELNQCLQILINHPKEIYKLGLKAFLVGQKKHDLQKIQRTLWEIFEKLSWRI